MPDGYFITPAEANQIKMREGIYRRTMGVTDEAMLCEFLLERGAEVPPHSHKNDQVGYLVYGSMEVTIGGEMRVLHQGESYAIPGGVEHSVQAVEDTLTIDVFSPPRNDYRMEAR